MGKKIEELKSLINAFGGTVEPTDDTVGDLIGKLVTVACKDYEITATCNDGVWSVDTPFTEIKEAVENKEMLHLIAEVGEGAYEVYQWVSYVDNHIMNAVVFARTECYGSETWVRTLYIKSDNTTDYHETYFINE